MENKILELKPCIICALPKHKVAKINSIFKKGNSAEEIGLAYSLDVEDLNKHFTTCSLEVEKKERAVAAGEDFLPKEKYERQLANLEILLANAYESLQDPIIDDETGKYCDNSKAQTSYAKLVDTYRSLIKDIEKQKNEEVIIEGLIETILNPLMQSMLKMIIEELDSLKSELSKHGELNVESQAMFTETFKKIGGKTKTDMVETIEKLYKFYKIKQDVQKDNNS